MSWSQDERDEKCEFTHICAYAVLRSIFTSHSIYAGISLQECMYGTKLLKRLEEIKESIDPNNIFNCNYCVGSAKTENKEEQIEMQLGGVEGEWELVELEAKMKA